MYFLVFLFMAKEVAGENDMQVAIVAGLQALPWLVLAPIAGRAADRFDRRKLMLLADIASSLVTLCFAVYVFYNPLPSITLIAAAGTILSCINVFFMPARSASIPNLVPGDRLTDANALAYSTQGFVSTAGTALNAGVLASLYATSPDLFFFSATLLNSITFGASALFIRKLPTLKPDRKEEDSKRVMAEIMEGIQVVKNNLILRIALPANGLISLAVTGFFVVYLKTNKDWFGGGFNTLAWIEFSFAVSMALGSIFVAKFPRLKPGIGFVIGYSIAGLTIAMMGFGQTYWVYIVWNIVCGLFIPFAWVPLSVYRQAGFSDHIRGRVNGLWEMVSTGIMPLGYFVIGLLIETTSLVNLYLFIGGAIVFVSLSTLLSRPFRTTVMPELQETPADV